GVCEVLWKTGDKVSVNGVLSDNAVTAAQNGTKNVDFTISASMSAPYKVLYPGSSSENVITLPATQNYVADSFDGAAAASYGNAQKSGDKYSVKLTNFCGLICFAVKGSATLDRIELKSLGSEKLRGDFTLATDADGFTGAFSGGTAGALTYDCDVTLSNTDTFFYIAIPAQTYAAGIEALVYQADGAFMRLKFWGAGYNLASNKLVEFTSTTYAAGRTENLLSINDLTAEDGGEPTAAPPGITVATYNVYQEESRESSKKQYLYLTNANVREALGTAIANIGADIIGFNELDSNFQNDGSYSLKTLSGLTGYTWELDHPDDIKKEGSWPNYKYRTYNEYADGFAYKTSLFDISDHNYVWLSHTADNTYYDDREDAYHNSGSPETTCVYAKFTHKVSGKQFYFFVTHTSTLAHTYSEIDAEKVNGEYSAEDQAAAAARRLRVINNLKYFTAAKAGSLPYIVVGDFNFGPYIDTKKTQEQPLYTAMYSGGFANAYDQVYDAGNLSGFYINYPGTETGSNWGAHYLVNLKYPQFRIDHIFLHDGFSQVINAQSYRTVRTTYDVGEDTWCPSDHFPVVSYITFD
nr:endonuclease/exonuclease/phosphatase family protein [Bacteroidales bacterium]